jgi:DNA-binding PadR family transcriptional regulator
MNISLEDSQDVCNFQDENCKKFIEKIIKANREIIVMSLILKKPMCGYDLIKDIYSKYDIFLSQGTVYPVLYAMEDEDLLQAEYRKGDMRTKRYIFTSKGKKIAEKEIENFLKALEQVSTLLSKMI